MSRVFDILFSFYILYVKCKKCLLKYGLISLQNTNKCVKYNQAVEDCGEKWGIFMFMGEYHHTLDNKGRIIIPAKYRELLGNEFIITRGIEPCIYAYPKETFEKIVAKLESLPFTKKDARRFTRFFMSGATATELDKQGRILLPSPLSNYASLEKDCVIVGVGERFEIWDLNAWTEFMNSANDEMSLIADGLFNEGI